MVTPPKSTFLKATEREATLGGAIAGRLGLLWGNAWQINPTVITNTQQNAWSESPILTPGLDELVAMRRKGFLTEVAYAALVSELGYNNAFAEYMFQTRNSLLAPSDYVSLWRRGEIDDNILYRMLTWSGFNDEGIYHLKTATEYLPSPQDLVLFAVREVYSPEVASKYGQFEDFPQEFLREAKKVGLSQEDARRYWGAHWELPSLTMGYNMFHRDIISEEELQQLMRSQDVMPFWRDKLIQLSHNPLTRVDVRRMYGFGVLDRTQVYKSYKDLGYNDENAELMTEFTTRYEEDETQGITRATVTKAYITGIIDDDTLLQLFDQMGYADQVKGLYYQQAKYDKLIKQLESISQDLENQFLTGALSIDKAREILRGLDAPDVYIANFTAKLKSREISRIKSASKSDIDRWFKDGFIGETEYSRRLKAMGYQQDDIVLYIRDHAMDGREIVEKLLPAATYARFLRKGIMDERSVRSRLYELNLRADDIEILIQEAKGG